MRKLACCLLLLSSIFLLSCAVIARAIGGPEAVNTSPPVPPTALPTALPTVKSQSLSPAETPHLNAAGDTIVIEAGTVRLMWINKDDYLILSTDAGIQTIPMTLIRQLDAAKKNNGSK